ncbi:MAG: DUF4199 domain-containing protein [Cyclobacteriaceae bacterium]|jgi:hypothetical protein
MEETKQQSTFLSNVLRWGLITGGVSIVFSIVLYVIDYTLMVQLKVLFIALAIYLGLAIYGGIDYRKSIGGFISYGKAFQHGFLILAISALVATLFNVVLYNVIDTDLPQKLTDASIENTRAMMENFGASEDAIDQAVIKAEESSKEQFTIVGQLKGYFFILIFSAIMALISALIVRKNEPVELS